MNLYCVTRWDGEFYYIEAPNLLTAIRLWHMKRDEEDPNWEEDPRPQFKEPKSVDMVHVGGVIRAEDFPPQPVPLGEDQPS